VAAELTIGEVAARSGVAPSALRFYEVAGLIAASRTTGNQPVQQAILRRIAVIQPARPRRSAGGDQISLATRNRVPTRKDWDKLSRRWRKDVIGVSLSWRACARAPDDVHRLRVPFVDRCTLLNRGNLRLGEAHYFLTDGLEAVTLLLNGSASLVP
jgi:MerR family redox-sensitive transcriptional activator SoxR